MPPSPHPTVVLSENEQQTLRVFLQHLPDLRQSGVLDLGSPEGRIGLHVLKQDAENFVTFVHRCWNRVGDAIISVGDALNGRPGQRARMSYQIGGLSRLEPAMVARHHYITCLLGGESLHGLTEGETGGANPHSAIQELLTWYAAQPRPQDKPLPRLLAALPESWSQHFVTLAESLGLEIETQRNEPAQQLTLFQTCHRRAHTPSPLPDEQVII